MSRARILAGCIAIAAMGAAGAVQASPYIGLGAGAVRLDPKLNESLSIKDSGRDAGYSAVIGKQFYNRFAAELYYTSLGTAELDPAGTVDYLSYGLATVWNLNATKHGSKRPRYFVKLGVGKLDTEAEGEETQITRQNDWLVNSGVGVVFPMRHGLSVRATLEVFDRDASMASAMLIKKFGSCHKGGCAHKKHHEMSGKHQQASAQELPKITTAASATDTVQMGSSDESQKISQLENVYFNSDSAYLTEMGESSLQLLIETMKSYPQMRVEVQGHTDVAEGGSARALSELRALRVGNYLMKKGVAAARISLIAYGATQPASAKAGSHLNRRVQLRILSVD